MDNRYFKVIAPNENMTQIYGVCLGDGAVENTSLDGTEIIVKLPLGDTATHGILNAATELTKAEARIERTKVGWRLTGDEY